MTVADADKEPESSIRSAILPPLIFFSGSKLHSRPQLHPSRCHQQLSCHPTTQARISDRGGQHRKSSTSELDAFGVIFLAAKLMTHRDTDVLVRLGHRGINLCHSNGCWIFRKSSPVNEGHSRTGRRVRKNCRAALLRRRRVKTVHTPSSQLRM